MGQRPDYYERDLVVELASRFAENVRARRLRLRLPQSIVAQGMRTVYGFPWHQTMVAKVESGERAVKLDEAFALCRILGIELDDLLRGRNMDVIRHGIPVVLHSPPLRDAFVMVGHAGDPDAPFESIDSVIERGLAAPQTERAEWELGHGLDQEEG